MVRVIAHRGARSLAPENTLAAFSRAQSLPVEMIEGDVTVTKDGIAVMIHQETLEPDEDFRCLRLAKRNEARAWIAEKTWSEISALDGGSWFGQDFSAQRIPKLTDILELPWREKTLLLDLIDPLYWSDPSADRVVQQFRSAVVPLLRTATQAGVSIAVLAFNPTMLEMFQSELPNIPRTLAIWTNHHGQESWIAEQCAKLQVQTLTIADFMLRDEPTWAELARQQGLELGVYEVTPDSQGEFKNWTPAQRKEIWELVIKNRVDWFTSDFPAEFVAFRQGRIQS